MTSQHIYFIMSHFVQNCGIISYTSTTRTHFSCLISDRLIKVVFNLKGRPVAVTSSKGQLVANPSPQASLDYERQYYMNKNPVKEEKLAGISHNIQYKYNI